MKMDGWWKEFFAFLTRFSPLWVTIILVCMILAYRSPDIISAALH